MSKTVHLGFAVPSGEPVEIPIAHTFVTGQTQLSGKTTTLRAIVERSERRALAFVTKRGEDFAGRRIPPYLPREGDKQIPWRLVETIMAAALGQRNMKWERGGIITASKGATTLQQVRTNVSRLQGKTKNGKTEELYMLLGEYLDLVLPEMAALGASATLYLDPGLNVMDLSDISTQTQAMVIRAALEHVNAHERGVLTVFPEAWEFAPRSRAAPAKDEAIAMARKGAAIGNFLLCDSQDIAGVDTVVRQAASVWILGVQRELNELKRTIQMIPAGIKRPKPEEVATLELGQFFACWGKHAIKVYVQPAWMSADDARRVATGEADFKPAPPRRLRDNFRRPPSQCICFTPRLGEMRQEPNEHCPEHGRATRKEDTVNEREVQLLRDDNTALRAENRDLRTRLEKLEAKAAPPATTRAPEPTPPLSPEQLGAGGVSSPRTFSVEESFDNERLYQAFKARLIDELPSDARLLQILQARPEIEVKVTRKLIEMDGDSLSGRIAILITEGWFDTPKGAKATANEMKRRGWNHDYRHVARACDSLTTQGFFRNEGSGYVAVAGMKVNIVEAAA